jgi:arabinan endo-1,5-alpha-L-arabinosidase
MQKSLLLVMIILLSACSMIPTPTPDPAEQIVIKPSATSTIIPSVTPTEVPPTLTPAPPTPTADTNFFRDDFLETLDPQWSWLREDPQNWSLTALPGSLQINVAGGYVRAHTNSNLLLRPAPEGNFQVETQITFRPADNFQFAGLIIYESDSTFIQAGRGYCKVTGCIGEGLYMDYYKDGVIVEPDFGLAFKEIDPIRLRLSRREDTYTFEASTDGKVWFIIGSHTSDLNPLQIGLVTGQRMKGNNLPAAFDYFEVRSLP